MMIMILSPGTAMVHTSFSLTYNYDFIILSLVKDVFIKQQTNDIHVYDNVIAREDRQ
jgi:hypothetical protein